MIIRYNVTGADRKKLVVAAGEALGAAPVYMKAPSFAYTVGGFVIDKDGALSCDGEADGAVLRDLMAALAG